LVTDSGKSVIAIAIAQLWINSHRQLLRYENERPELIFSIKKKHILKNN
jgi:hypothetical protein